MDRDEARRPPGFAWMFWGLVLLAAFLVNATNRGASPSGPSAAEAVAAAKANSFRVVAESEIKSLEQAGILSDFTSETGIKLSIDYRGPVDIRQAVESLRKNNPKTVDAYWPGSSLWLPGSYTVEPESVMKTYVVLAVDPDIAADLGWDPAAGVAASDLVSAVEAGRVKLAMTSATQSTPGAIFFLAMYTALTDKQVLTSQALANAGTARRIEAMLKKVERSGVDLDRLKEVFVEDKISGQHRTNAIVIYESLAIKMNRELVAGGARPMTVFYVEGATAMADAPIRYVDNEDEGKLEQYEKLVAFLNRPGIQEKIRDLGWRTSPIGMRCEECKAEVFRPEWGIDTTTEFPEMIFPKPPVAKAALAWYQAYGRKPSYTVYCLDYSGSMDGGGRAQMIDAMDLLLDQERATEVSLEATSRDIAVVYGFSRDVQLIGNRQGNEQKALKALSRQISLFQMGLGTAMFDCVEKALSGIGASPDPTYNYSVIALTDGNSNEGATESDFAGFLKDNGFETPVYGIAFGSASFVQLEIFKTTGGDVYDGREDAASAFRLARGNN